MRRRRVVITGASGNVGTALLRKLAAANTDYEVHGIVRRAPPPTDAYRVARWHEVNLADPRVVTRLQRLFHKAHCVVHLAWALQPTRNPRYVDAVGVAGSSAVLIAAHAADVGHLVYLSSAGTYAATPGRRVDESWSTAGVPTSAYSRAKSAVEALLDDYDRTGNGVPITRLRPGLIVQRDAAASIRRYAFPTYLHPRWLRRLPVLALDGALQVR
jgi:UDP-glucose 4-epimerase